jgi:hypothetical protein
MLDWIRVNLFFLAIVLIGAGAMFATFSVVKWMHLGPQPEMFAYIVAAVIALVATGYATRWLYRFIGRFVRG